MQITPINRTNSVFQQQPSFRMARINKTILSQIKDKQILANNIDIVSITKGIIYSIPTAIAAYLISNNKLDDKTLETNAIEQRNLDIHKIEELSKEELTGLAKAQNEEGKTIIFREHNWDLPAFLEKNIDSKDLLEAYTLKDKDGDTAYTKTQTLDLKNSIYRLARSGKLSLEESINLLKTNKMDENVIKFLEYRAEKKDGNSIVNKETLQQILNGNENDLSVVAGSEYDYYENRKIYKGLNLKTAAKVFNYTKDDKFSTVDIAYLENAEPEVLSDLFQQTIKFGNSSAFDYLNHIIQSNKKINNGIKKIIPDINILNVNGLRVKAISHAIQEKDYLRLYTQTNEEKENSLHIAARNDNTGDNFEEHLDIMRKHLGKAEIDNVLFSKDNKGKIPAGASRNALYVNCKYYKQRPDMIIKLLKTKDNNNDTPLHCLADESLLQSIINLLDGKYNEDLADILSMKNNKGKTIYEANKREYYDYNDPTKLLRKLIIKLATDSDLSLEKSYELLNSNNLEPAIQEFLKLQIESNNK